MRDPLLGEFDNALQAITVGENVVRLPKSGSNVALRKKLGFTEISESASWYYVEKLPKGWTVEQDPDDIESCNIFDEKARKRGSISIILANSLIVAAFTHFYHRFYGLVEEVKSEENGEIETGRVLFLYDRTDENYKVRFCRCDRMVEDFMDSQDCINTAMYQLDKTFPGCNDIDNWDDETLSAYQEYVSEFEICRCCNNHA